MIDPTPCQCESCVELRQSTNPEAVEFMKALDELEAEHHREVQQSKAEGKWKT